MGLTIKRLNGITYKTDDFGLRLIDFYPKPPEYNTKYETIEGCDGAIDLGTTTGVRTLVAEFNFYAADSYDFPLFRNEIFKMYHSKEAFYIIDDREPGKRWLAKVASSTIEKIRYIKGNVKMEFVADFPYAESIGTTMDQFTFDSGLWQIGQGLIAEELQYTHTTKIFRIFNAGDITLDPNKLPLKVRVKGYTDNFIIRNKTTGDTFTYYGPPSDIETLELKGVQVLKNNTSVFKDTNYKLITIVPGWNDFEVAGVTSVFRIEFDFRFYYL